MISYIDTAGNAVPISDYEKLHIKHKQDGNDTCSFLLNTTLPAYKGIHEETVIYAGGNEWLVKKIDDDKIDCELNFDFLKKRFYKDFLSETKSLSEVLEAHLPNGWTVEGGTVSTIRRTISFELCTDYDIVMECLDVYDVRFLWHIPEHSVTVVKPSLMNPTGEYVTSELNLKKLSFRGQSVDFATRIYAYGANGMTMEEAIVEGEEYGLPYIDSREYCDKTIITYWKDERYTNPTNLYEDAKVKLEALSFPVRSYECSIVDLAKQDERYSFLDFAMHKVVALLDIERGIAVAHQVVEYDEYPDEPDQNVVTLASVADTIQGTIKANRSSGGEEAAERVRTELLAYVNQKDAQQTSHADQIGESMMNRLNMATAMLMAGFGTYQYEQNGSLFLMDNPDPAEAEVVWRFNVNGFGKSSTGIDGPYTTAMTVDDTFLTNIIEAMVIRGSFIEAGTITADKIAQSYSDGILSQAFVSAQGMVQSLASEISSYLDDPDEGKLTVINEHLVELSASITQTAGSISAVASRVDTIEAAASSSIEVQYALGTSSTTAPTTGWSASSPTWESGKYVWQRTVTTYINSTESDPHYSISEPTCIQGAKGEDGADGDDGVGISSIVPQYYLSTSNTTQIGGSWSTTAPAWQDGKYIWVRSFITWDDGTTSYTTPQLDNAANGLGSSVAQVQANLNLQADRITAEVTARSNGDALLASQLSQTSSEISAQVSALNGSVATLMRTRLSLNTVMLPGSGGGCVVTVFSCSLGAKEY